MPAVARLNDSIEGMTAGCHCGADPPHPPCTITGHIDGNCSPNVFVNGLPMARVGSTTFETDCCCTSSGIVAEGSSTVFVNGIPVSRLGDIVTPHNGTAEIIAGSPNVNVGG